MGNKFNISRHRHKNADFIDVDTEKKLLGALLHNKRAFVKLVRTFNSKVFTNLRIKKIYDRMVNFYFEDGEYVKSKNILDTIKIPPNKKKAYEVLFDKIVKAGKLQHSTDFVMTCKYKLEQYYDARILELGMKDAIEILVKARYGDYKGIKSASDIICDLSTMVGQTGVSSVKVNPVNNFNKWLNNFETFQKHPSEMLGIPTCIPQIDAHITGLRPSEFGLCIADTGVGKSIFLLDVGINCWLRYGDVVYVTIEMPAQQLEDRFWCNISGINYDKFRKLRLNDKDKSKLKRISKRYSKHEHSFHILDMNEGCTVLDMVSELENYIKAHDIKLVVIDYMNIIAGNDGKVSLDWETQVGIALNIKQFIARKFNVPTWSACQVTGDNLAFSRHIKDNIDIGLKLEEDENTEYTGVMNVSYPKSRDFRGSMHKLQTNRGIMKIFTKTAPDVEL